MRQHRFECLAVGMDIGVDGDPHGGRIEDTSIGFGR